MKKHWTISLCAIMLVSIIFDLAFFTGEGSNAYGQEQVPAMKFMDRDSKSTVEVTPVLAERHGKEFTINDFGKWDLKKLGYSDIAVPCQDRYGAISANYILPEDAAQGNEKWYVLNLYLEIELGQNSQEGECEVIVYTNNVICNQFHFFSKTEEGSLRFYNGDAEISSGHATVTDSVYIPGYTLYTNGVLPGKNSLNILMIKYGGIEVNNLKILNSSSVECTDIPTPEYSSIMMLRNYVPKLTSAEEAKAKDIVMNDASLRNLIAGRKFTIDLVYDWDMPQVSGKVARVDISLDRVYQIEYDWPWPPEPIRKDTHHATCWVREMTVIVSLEEGTVLGIMPQRHPISVDPANLPEDLRPEGYTPIPEVNIPELTADEAVLAKEMALKDPVVQQMLANKEYEIHPMVLHTSGDLKKIGAALDIQLDKAYWFDYDKLPDMGAVKGNPEYSAYMESLRSNGGLWADRLMVMVSFEENKVVEAMPIQVSQYGGEK